MKYLSIDSVLLELQIIKMTIIGSFLFQMTMITNYTLKEIQNLALSVIIIQYY